LERINELIELSGMVECFVELSLEKLMEKTAKDTPVDSRTLGICPPHISSEYSRAAYRCRPLPHL